MKTGQLIPCKSSMLKGYAYDPASKTLTLQFKSGVSYEYQDVPLPVYEGMCAAESIGSFFSKNIRGQFKASEVNQDDTQ